MSIKQRFAVSFSAGFIFFTLVRVFLAESSITSFGILKF